MAIYHCSVQIIGRNSGRSSVAAAAYRAAEKIINEYDGVEHDFRRKNWVEFTKIILPKNAPQEYADRGTLWNAVERAENSKDAQLCREFELALPVEMTREQQREVVEQYVKENLVSQGMIADIAIHNPPVTNDRHQPIDINGNVTKDINAMQFRNPHAHILATIRPLDAHGKWQKKSETEYLCRRGNEEKGFTASEFKVAKEQGWEKQYKYLDGRKKVWLTATEGKEHGLERVNRSPRTTPYGRKNAIVEYWNSKDRIFEWRQAWEKIVNDKFVQMQSEVRIDHRSFKNQGREEELPTLHLGPSAVNMEKRAERELREGKQEDKVIHSDIGDINKMIREHNQFIKEVKVKFKTMAKEAENCILAASKELEGIRANIISAIYQKTELFNNLKTILTRLKPAQDRLEKYRAAADKTERETRAAAKRIRELENKIKASGNPYKRKVAIWKEEIGQLHGQIESYKEYMESVTRMCGYDTRADYRAENGYCAESDKDCWRLKKTIDKLQMDISKLVLLYKKRTTVINRDYFGRIDKKREEIRGEMEETVKDMLRNRYKDSFNEKNFLDAVRTTDKTLGNIRTEKKYRKVNVTEKTIHRKRG